MKARLAPAAIAAIALAGLSLAVPARASNDPEPRSIVSDVDAIDRAVKAAYDEGGYAFCKDPPRPLGPRQRGLCPLAAEIDGCEGFAGACRAGEVPKEQDWLERMAAWLAPFAKGLLYLLVLGIVIVVAIPVVRALLKWRRDRSSAAPATDAPNRALVVPEAAIPAEEISDAEAALRLAEEHRTRGERKRALGLYLAASLAALDRRGALRLARHRTNGEYVRGCEEAAARTSLREIVREVDKVEFGGAPATDEGLSRVAARARSIVRVAASTLLVLTLAVGCSAPRRGADPAGDELPIAVLTRSGFEVSALRASLATMPIPEPNAGDAAMPVVIVDAEKVPLEDEARAHMMRWVESGGALVLFGRAQSWPDELRPDVFAADTRDIVVRARDPFGELDDSDAEDEDEAAAYDVVVEIEGARAARPHAFTWEEAPSIEVEPLALLGKATYAAKRRVGKGIVLGVANDDLFTNVGAMRAQNAAALVTLLRSVAYDPSRWAFTSTGDVRPLGEVRVARAEDGVPPPANPFAALVAAGLGKGAWHALAAAALLFLAYGVRHARPRAAARRARRAFAEHVEATGAFYGRARAHAHALGAYGHFIDARLRESLPRGADPIAYLASRSGADPAHVAEIYARALEAKAGDPPRGDELAVIEELRRLMVRATSGRRAST